MLANFDAWQQTNMTAGLFHFTFKRFTCVIVQMRHHLVLKIKHFSRSIFRSKHIPNHENITVKHFPNFQDFVWTLQRFSPSRGLPRLWKKYTWQLRLTWRRWRGGALCWTVLSLQRVHPVLPLQLQLPRLLFVLLTCCSCNKYGDIWKGVWPWRCLHWAKTSDVQTGTSDHEKWAFSSSFYPLICHVIIFFMWSYLDLSDIHYSELWEGIRQMLSFTGYLFFFFNLQYLKQIFATVSGCLFNHMLSKWKQI